MRSVWLPYRAVAEEHGARFGRLALERAAYSIGWNPIYGNRNDPKRQNDGMAVFSSFLDSSLSFAATKGKFINGVTDPTQFAKDLNTKQAGFGIGPNGPNPAYVGLLSGRITNMADCLALQ